MVMPKQKPGLSSGVFATPKPFFEAVKQLLGIERFTIDLAAHLTNALAPHWLTEEDNALDPKWDWAMQIGSGWGWLNPPFADIEPWAKKCHMTALAGGQVAFLVPLSSSNWCRDWVFNKSLLIMLNGRLSFMGGPLYPKDCMLCLYGMGAGTKIWDWRKSIPGLSWT